MSYPGPYPSSPQPTAIDGIAPNMILAPTLSFSEKVREALLALAQASGLEKPITRKPIARAVPVFAGKRLGVVGPAIGAPAAAIVAETLARSGLKRLVLFGSAGALAESIPNVAVGDIVFPRGCIGEDGTSKLYGRGGLTQFHGSALQVSIEDCLKEQFEALNIGFHHGLISTTDAPYCETAEKAQAMSKIGVSAVEMEFAAVQTLAELRGFELGACFVVSDVWKQDIWVSGFSKPRFRQTIAVAAKALVGML